MAHELNAAAQRFEVDECELDALLALVAASRQKHETINPLLHGSVLDYISVLDSGQAIIACRQRVMIRRKWVAYTDVSMMCCSNPASPLHLWRYALEEE